MKITCPMCDTRYSVGSSIPSGSRAVVTCAVCQTQLDVVPRRIIGPKVTVRQAQSEHQNTEAKIDVKQEDSTNGQVG